MKPTFAILPHPKAPLFNNAGNGQATLRDLINDVGGAHPTNPTKILDYLRQAGYVSLYFFLRFIAGANGPYHFLNTGVHLDLCNFRQSEDCMTPGAAVAIFLPRQFAKTTIATTGATGWELLRDPDKRVLISNATAKKAQEFLNTTQRIFDTNPVVRLLYPDYVLDPNQNTMLKLNMPNARVRYNEPSVSSVGVDTASAGGHYDILQNDDLIGLEDVDANYSAQLSMARITTWMSVNFRTLLVSPMTSRKFVVGTRYGPDDAYDRIWKDCKKFVGYKNDSMTVKEDGNWTVYYRHVIEDGVATNPFVLTLEAAAKMQHEDPLTYAYQYANDVTVNLNNEFAAYTTPRFTLKYSKERNDYALITYDQNGRENLSWLSMCSTCISVDWAGSDKQKSAKTSRSSIAFWARDSFDRCYRIDQFVGFFDIIKVFDNIYTLAKRWRGYVSVGLIEPNAMQLAVAQLIEADKRFLSIGFTFNRKAAVGDKVVRIRAGLGGMLAQGLIHLHEYTSVEFTEERLAFQPGSKKLDVLDESEKAISYLHSPTKDIDVVAADYMLDGERVMEYATSDTGDGELSAFPW